MSEESKECTDAKKNYYKGKEQLQNYGITTAALAAVVAWIVKQGAIEASKRAISILVAGAIPGIGQIISILGLGITVISLAYTIYKVITAYHDVQDAISAIHEHCDPENRPPKLK